MKLFLFWSSRILSIVFVAFLSLFALDIFGEGHELGQTIMEFFIHLIPSFLAILVIILSWRRDWIGVLFFGAGGLGYLFMNLNHPSWILTISCPLLSISILFLLHWRYQRKVHSGS